MITLFNRGFMPVTSRLDSTVDKILKDPFWDEMDSFFHKPISNYHLDKNEKSYTLEIAVPGLSKKDLKVKMIKGQLNISGGKKDDRWCDEFDKTFNLPEGINTKKIKAKVENGLLSIDLPIKEDVENDIEII
tara:strand:- start:194 stop:589 length:396 start_codon:yes stop_codon:yes gene_type:complete